MKVKKYIIIFFVLPAFHSAAQNYYHLFLKDNSGTLQETVSPDLMTERIKKDALAYSKYAPVPRLAEIDFAFGMDLEEFNKLQGYGVLYVPSLNQDSTEYPIKRAYLKSNGTATELKEIGAIRIPIKDKQTILTFGKNRVDYYYLIPYYLIRQSCELLIDWSNNRKEFLLAKFPNSDKLDFVKNNTPSGDPKNIDRTALKKFLMREYKINME